MLGSITHVAVMNRSKRSASLSRSGRSLARLGRWIVPPLRRFSDSSIGPSFCPSRRSDKCKAGSLDRCRPDVRRTPKSPRLRTRQAAALVSGDGYRCGIGWSTFQ
jgi:hypothetical protein